MKAGAGWVCRAIVLMGVLVVVARILRHLTGPSDGSAVLPAITGDTWPPVPVKISR